MTSALKNKPAIILVRPQMGENIGAAARAMMNFNLSDLRLVAPRDGWPNPRAIDMASGALDIMPEPQIFETLHEALADCQYALATTARRRDMVKPVFTPQGAMPELHKHSKTALVFGPERTGLENDDLALCNGFITVPTNPDFASINLGQSVLLLAYEWMRSIDGTPDQELPTGNSAPASHQELEDFFTRLEKELEAGHFFRDEGLRPTMVRNIRSSLIRATPTEQEVRTWHGIISSLIGNKTQKKA